MTTQPDLFPFMPRRLSHDEIMAGFAELRRVMALPDFPLRYGGRPLPSGDVGGSTASRICAGPGDEFNEKLTDRGREKTP